MIISHWISLSLLVLLSWGVVGVLQKMATNRISMPTALIWAAAGFMLLQPWMLPTTSLLAYSPKSLLYALLNGVCNGLGILFLMLAMRRGGKACIVESLSALYPVFVVMLSPALLGERITGLRLLGVACAAIGGILLSTEANPQTEEQTR